MKKRGLFIVIEGLDRSGKTTQINLLSKHLKDSKYMEFPNRSTSMGRVIDGYLKQEKKLSDHAIHLLFSANRWECQDELAQMIYDKSDVVCSRYAYSGVAYSMAKGTLPVDWCKQVDCGLLRPDIVIYLDMDPEKATKRSQYGEERYEKLKFQKLVKVEFEKLFDEKYWVRVPADQSIEQVHAQIKESIENFRKEIGDKLNVLHLI